MAEARTIIQTKTAGWFLNPETGKKTRKQDGDQILTEKEWNDLQKEVKATEATEVKEAVVLSTGKIAHGPTVTIKCSNFKECGNERTIMKQDAFQVKHCVDCQKVERNRRRRERRKAKNKSK